MQSGLDRNNKPEYNTFTNILCNPNIRNLHKFGRNPDVSTTHEDIWMGGGLYNWQSSASTLEVVTLDLADDAAGLGIQRIKIQGLDVNCNEIEEEVDLVGAGTSSITSKSFLRVNRAFGVSSGTYHGSNYNLITIQVSGGGDELAIIDGDPFAATGSSEYGVGQTESSIYTVPAGYTAYVTHVEVNVDVASNKTATVVLYQCGVENGSVRRVLWLADSISGSLVNDFNSPLKVEEKTDIWFHGRASASAAIDVDYSLFLVKNL
jgi:hypothetical protein